MNDVWGELEERLKQKSKTANEIIRVICVDRLGYLQYYIPCHDFSTKDKREWVRLENVQKLIEQIKQKYVLIPKEKLKEDIRYLELKLLSYGNNDMPMRGVYAGKLTALKELLRKNASS